MASDPKRWPSDSALAAVAARATIATLTKERDRLRAVVEAARAYREGARNAVSYVVLGALDGDVDRALAALDAVTGEGDGDGEA